DEGANTHGPAESGQPYRISRADSRISVWVIPTNEELMIARHTRLRVPDFRQQGSERLIQPVEATSA
ncbi:MAG: hypothetical protein WAV91_03070, partial [Aquabacterium sp.]